MRAEPFLGSAFSSYDESTDFILKNENQVKHIPF